jgi:hypothetical protein
MGGPETVPMFPSSPVPRAKMRVRSVQQVLSLTPFSVEEPAVWGLQELPAPALPVDVGAAAPPVAVAMGAAAAVDVAAPPPRPPPPSPENQSLHDELPGPDEPPEPKLGMLVGRLKPEPSPVPYLEPKDGMLVGRVKPDPRPVPVLDPKPPVGRAKDGMLKAGSCGCGIALATEARARSWEVWTFILTFPVSDWRARLDLGRKDSSICLVETKDSTQHNKRLKFEAKANVIKAKVGSKSMSFFFCWKRGFLYLPHI